jgi:hypothetical protein
LYFLSLVSGSSSAGATKRPRFPFRNGLLALDIIPSIRETGSYSVGVPAACLDKNILVGNGSSDPLVFRVLVLVGIPIQLHDILVNHRRLRNRTSGEISIKWQPFTSPPLGCFCGSTEIYTDTLPTNKPVFVCDHAVPDSVGYIYYD